MLHSFSNDFSIPYFEKSNYVRYKEYFFVSTQVCSFVLKLIVKQYFAVKMITSFTKVIIELFFRHFSIVRIVLCLYIIIRGVRVLENPSSNRTEYSFEFRAEYTSLSSTRKYSSRSRFFDLFVVFEYSSKSSSSKFRADRLISSARGHASKQNVINFQHF